MQRLVFTAFLFLSYCSAMSQWNVKSIPDTLLTNSNAVIRRYATDIRVLEDDQVVVSENLVITFLESSALKIFIFNSIVAESISNNSIESKFFDTVGRKIKQTKIKANSTSEGILIQIISPTLLDFPITMEVEYKLVVDGVKNLKTWNPTMNFSGSVESASLRVSASDTSSMNFKYNQIPNPIRTVDEDGMFVFLWELNNFSAIKIGSSSELPIELPSLTIAYY